MVRSPVVLRNIEVPLRHLPPSLTGVRLAHISDFHLSHWSRVYEAAQSLLADLDYDLLLVTGDVGHWPSKWRESAELAQRFFKPLVGRAPIYAVIGNHDHPDLATHGHLPMTYLRNQGERISIREGSFQLAGLEQTSAEQGDLEAALGPAEDSDGCTILLAHYPSTVFRLPAGRVDLMLSGHTHGGQIRLPWLGCLWPNDAIPRSMARGLHMVGGTSVHVSAGLGTSLPIRMRIFCPAELSILTLQPVESGSICESHSAEIETKGASVATLD